MDNIYGRLPMSLDDHWIWSHAWLLWFNEKLRGPNDNHPLHKHFVRAKLLFVVEHGMRMPV